MPTGDRLRPRARAGPARALVPAAILALVGCLAGAGCTVERTGASPRPSTSSASTPTAVTPVASVRVAGEDVPYVDSVPWSDAVAPDATMTQITIYADGDRIGHGICPLPVERVFVEEGSTAVKVTVAGYGEPLPVGHGCAAVGHSPQPLTVHLHAPLGSRHLVDVHDGFVHRVLDATTAPTTTAVPTGFRAEPVRWIEGDGAVTRSWSDPATDPPATISITRGPAAAFTSDDGAGAPTPQDLATTKVTTGIDIDGHQGTASDCTDEYGEMIGLGWTQSDGQQVRLSTSEPPGGHLGLDQAIALARSTT